MDYGDTQIIYSTHSNQISEVSNLTNINVLSKRRNHAISFQPARGLSEDKVEKLERYLDAIRTNLLFAKGVMLVEGDAEELLVPLLIKNVLGVSLDELGVSIINVRSTGFENIAEIFHNDRIQRKCAIITDLDASIINYAPEEGDGDALEKFKSKCRNSEIKGAERKARLDEFVKDNDWLDVFYADHTFEVDFLMEGNQFEVGKTLLEIYEDKPTIKLAKEELDSGDVGIAGRRVLTMAKNKGKGWFAILLGKYVDHRTYIPDYIADAINFAIPKLGKAVISDIVKYRIEKNTNDNESLNFDKTKVALKSYLNNEANLTDLIDTLEGDYENDAALNFFKAI